MINNNSHSICPGVQATSKKRKNEIQITIDDTPLSRIPSEVWMNIFDIIDESKTIFSCCKSWQLIIEKEFKNLNKKENLICDKNQLHPGISERMIYFSNKLFFKMLIEHRNLFFRKSLTISVLNNNGMRNLEEAFFEFDKICCIIKEDKIFLKRDNIIKSCTRLLSTHINVKNYKFNSNLKMTQEKIMQAIIKLISINKPNKQYQILYNYIADLNPETHFEKIPINYMQLPLSPYHKLTQNNEELKKLTLNMFKSPEQWAWFIELSVHPLQNDLLNAALSHTRGGKHKEASGYWQKYFNNHLFLNFCAISEIENACFSFSKIHLLKELTELCTRFINDKGESVTFDEIKRTAKICRNANQFKEAATIGIEIDRRFGGYLSIDDLRSIAEVCNIAKMYDETLKFNIKITDTFKNNLTEFDILNGALACHFTNQVKKAYHLVTKLMSQISDVNILSLKQLETLLEICQNAEQFKNAAVFAKMIMKRYEDKPVPLAKLQMAMNACYKAEYFEDAIQLGLRLMKNFENELFVDDVLTIAHAYSKVQQFEKVADLGWIIDEFEDIAMPEDIRMVADAYYKTNNLEKAFKLYVQYIDKTGGDVKLYDLIGPVDE